MPDNSKPRRRWFRFSLRTLLLLVMVASCAFGWLGMTVRQAQRQRAAVEAIAKLGGNVKYDFEFDSKCKAIDSPSLPGPAWLLNLFGVDFLADVAFVDVSSSFTDADLVLLQSFPRLKLLQFVNTEITDAGMVHLQGLTELRIINLYYTHVTDAGLTHLQGLANLQKLYINDAHITDKSSHELRTTLPTLQICHR